MNTLPYFAGIALYSILVMRELNTLDRREIRIGRRQARAFVQLDAFFAEELETSTH